MSKYVVACDLLTSGENFDQLLDQLKVLGAVRVTETTWILNSNLTVEQVGRRIVPHVVRAFVGELAGLASWLNPLSEDEEIKAMLR